MLLLPSPPFHSLYHHSVTDHHYFSSEVLLISLLHLHTCYYQTSLFKTRVRHPRSHKLVKQARCLHIKHIRLFTSTKKYALGTCRHLNLSFTLQILIEVLVQKIISVPLLKSQQYKNSDKLQGTPGPSKREKTGRAGTNYITLVHLKETVPRLQASIGLQEWGTSIAKSLEFLKRRQKSRFCCLVSLAQK